MPFAAFNAFRLSIVGALILTISKLDTSLISDGLLELVLVGRLPGTEVYVSYEAFFAGIVFFAWAILTYNFTISAIIKIHDEIRNTILSQNDIDEVAL